MLKIAPVSKKWRTKPELDPTEQTEKSTPDVHHTHRWGLDSPAMWKSEIAIVKATPTATELGKKMQAL